MSAGLRRGQGCSADGAAVRTLGEEASRCPVVAGHLLENGLEDRILRQVFGILLDNAVKYSRDGEEVEVVLESESDTVVISVSDRGIGLTKEELKHVFIRFYRSKDAEGHETGSGLGLPVAKAIVEAHDGEIALEPRPGGGITSRVRLPLNRELGASA